MSNAIGSSRESNLPRKISHLRAVPLGHTAEPKNTRKISRTKYACVHVLLTYLNHILSDIYIGNIRLIYRTNCTSKLNQKHSQNKSHIFYTRISEKFLVFKYVDKTCMTKLFFCKRRMGAPFEKKKDFVRLVLRV